MLQSNNMSTITPECIQPISDDFLKKQVETGGLVPDYAGPEIWDCTDERELAVFHALRRQLEFGKNTPSYAIAGAREGFAIIDLVLRASQKDGETSLRRYEDFLYRTGAVSAFVCHSVRFAQNAQYGKGADFPDVVQAFDREYRFFRTLKDPNIGKQEIAEHRERLLELGEEYDVAYLNTHSDTPHERGNHKIENDTDQPDVGCAHNKLAGTVSNNAADPRLIPTVTKLAKLIGFRNLPFQQAQQGFAIVADNINDGDEPYVVKRDSLVAEHSRRYKPADVILDGKHLPPAATSLIVDGANTARNIGKQAENEIQTFMSNPVKLADRLNKLSEFGNNRELTIATGLLHCIAVRNLLLGNAPQDDPNLLPVYAITPRQLANFKIQR